MNTDQLVNRRPLGSRSKQWSALLLKLLLKTSWTPNQISIASLGFASLAAVGFGFSGTCSSITALLCAIIGMQGRLLCNLMDGMVAVEGGRSSKAGELYNELPDRISDIVILVAAGYGYNSYSFALVSAATLGWSAALVAVLTAYVRVFGASVGAGQIFVGPMAKPHRMALLTATCVLEIGLLLVDSWQPLIPWALLIVVLGSLVTIYRRLSRILSYLSGT